MNQYITYTVKSKMQGYIWQFKYHLNGAFMAFEVLEGELTDTQMRWLFCGSNFPATENMMTGVWMAKDLKKNFEITIGAPAIDFENLWNLYNYKVKRELSEKAFNKLSEGDKIKCFLALKGYERHLKKSQEARAHLVTWINQKRFNDEY